ncbi:MAG: CDP-diacylglycerol--glycerol-3-phosphate 3-phosphatidyltransferase [Gammaproteobacteria bacterium]|nr:CDP-diacylglycerol--glycerol-3-phosphate 3-phosphatidyltransferase [Gammaproteobacteria bacterium]
MIPLNVPNTITLFRIVLIPVFIAVYYLPHLGSKHLWLTLLFFIAGVSDWVDGYLARKLQQQSAFGAFLDPVADKLTISTILVLILSTHPGIVLALPAIVIIGREIAISALREWMANIGKIKKVSVSFVGKVKTFAQFWAIGFLLYEHPLGGIATLSVGYVLLYLAAGLTLWSMLVYLVAAWPSLVGSDSPVK